MRKEIWKICVLFLLVVANIGIASAANVKIDPAEKTVDPGDTFTVNVYIDPGGENTAGAQFNLSFDPSVLTANSVTEGNFLKQGGATTFFNPGTIDNGVGTINYVYGAILTPGQSVNTPGIFATISFTAKNVNGVSVLDLSDVVVGRPDGTEQSVTLADGGVVVGTPPAPVPEMNTMILTSTGIIGTLLVLRRYKKI